MKNLNILFILVGIMLICCGCTNDEKFYKHLSKSIPYNEVWVSIEDWFFIPLNISLNQRQIIKLKNGDLLLKNQYNVRTYDSSYKHTYEYYLPEDYANDYGKLMLDFDKYPSKQTELIKNFCKKYFINCGSEPTLEHITDDMSYFYKVSPHKKYKMISKEDRNNDIQECKNIMNELRHLSIEQADFWQKHIYYQYKLISGIKAPSNTSFLGDKEYVYKLNQNTNSEWIVEYRTNYSICKAYTYPDGTGIYRYRPAILDPNKKWNIWLGYSL